MLVHIIRKLKVPHSEVPVEIFKISNLTERSKQRIIRALSEEFDFTVEDRNNYSLEIDGATKDDIEIITAIVNRLESEN